VTKTEEKKLLQKRKKLKELLQTTDLSSILPNLPEGDQRELLAELLEESLYEKARTDFHTFVRLMAPSLLPEGFTDGAHIRIICKALMDLEKGTENGGIDRLMVFLPPGYMKSILCSKLFPAWCFGRNPVWNILQIGHGTQFSEDNFGRPLKDMIESDEYKRIFPGTSVKQDVRAAGRWETDQGGRYFATGVGSAITGRRGHIAILDDVVTEHTAYSDLEREKINAWYSPGLKTRLLPKGKELIINTRWHDSDLAGYLLKSAKKNKDSKQWTVISIPALCDKTASELLGLKEGESSWPEFWPTETLLDLKNAEEMTSARWAALYMQNPTPDSGNLIKLEWCKLWSNEEAQKLGLRDCTQPPPTSYVLISLDTAFSEKETADFSAYTVWGIFQKETMSYNGRMMSVPSMILLDSDKGRWGFPDLCRKVQALYDFHKPDGVLIEKKASGQSLIQEMRRRNLPVIEYNPDTDKLNRVHACTPFFENSRVWFPDTDWAFELIQDLTRFPNVSKRDLVDTVSQAILWMRDSWQVSSIDNDDDEDAPTTINNKTYWQTLMGR
jgi:predicted phage terminase large subunit-like protein